VSNYLHYTQRNKLFEWNFIARVWLLKTRELKQLRKACVAATEKKCDYASWVTGRLLLPVIEAELKERGKDG